MEEDGDGIILVIAESERYVETNNTILSFLTRDLDLPGIYVTVNKPFTTLTTELDRAGIDTDNIFFIDAISRETGMEDVDGNVSFLPSPEHLTDISIAMTEAYNGMKDRAPLFLFFDSLSTLTIYHGFDTVSQFAHYLTGRLRKWEVKGIIMSIEDEADDELINQLSQFCDAVIRI